MQTAQATLVGHEGSNVRILFDSGGSHKSFITRSVVESSGIEPPQAGRVGNKDLWGPEC